MPQIQAKPILGVTHDGDWTAATVAYTNGNDALMQPHTPVIPPQVGFVFVLLVIFIFFRMRSEERA